MRSIIILASVLLISQYCAAQNVGIGTQTPHASASLDISDTTRGLLVPRMSAEQRNAIAAPARGLLVFVTTDSSFYFYNGQAWQSLQFADTTAWKRTGNAGTNAATHFIGTTDNVPLVFRVNNQLAGRISGPFNNGSTFWGYQAGNSSAANGYDNTFIGYQTGLTNTTGNSNTATGTQALYFNSIGVGNTAYGWQSMFSNSTGHGNTATGYKSLQSNTSGYSNTAIGSHSLESNTIGYQNTASGFQSLFNNTEGLNNTASGFQSMYNNRSGLNNTATGTQALFSNTTGNSNTAGGFQSLHSNTSGSNNVATGAQSLYSNTTGNQNNAFGQQALFNNTSGGFNTAVGYQSLFINTTASANTAIGSQSLQLNTVGVNNSAVGYQSLQSNSTGNNNTAIGYQSLSNNSIGDNNSAIGFRALYYNTAAGNTAMGFQSLFTNTTGNQNTASGTQAMQSNNLGSRNTAGGFQSLKSNDNGHQNTAYGWRTLSTNSTGSNNSAIGFQADVASDNLNNATAIGAFSQVAASNSLVLGSIQGINGASISAKVGIGTAQPAAPLHVVGASANTSATAMRFFNFGSTGITPAAAWDGSATIYAEGNVCATQAFISAQSFNFSDARIKQIIGPANNQQDLERLRHIEVTRYRYIDTLANGSAVQTKVIAQQLKEVMPEAVSYRAQFIPSIMQMATGSSYNTTTGELTLIVTKLPVLPADASVKCYAENGTEVLYKLVAAHAQSIVLKGPHVSGRLFVYGHEVPDFHVVDYDAINMLNVSATQALLKRIEELEAAVKKLQR